MKMLLAILSLFGLLGYSNQETIQEHNEVFQHERNYQHTENVGNTTVTYKYESNDVNSADDLIIGNIYSIGDIDENLGFTVSDFGYGVYFNFKIIDGHLFFNNTGDGDVYFDDILYPFDFSNNSIYITFDCDNDFCSLFVGDWYEDNGVLIILDGLYFSTQDLIIQLLDFQVNDTINNYGWQRFSYTDYNVIESVEYVAPTTVIGVINNFCTDYLFKDIPYVNEMTFTVGGQSISLMTYLVMLVGIGLAVGLLILLIYIFKWLFLMFAGLFKVK